MLKYDQLSESPFSDHSVIIREVPSGSRVLDVGCATGYLAPGLKAKGCHVTGLDQDEEALRKASQVCDQVLRIDLESEDPWPLSDEAFDVLVLSNVLEHVRWPSRVMERLKAPLKSGGLAISVLPNVAKWNMRIALLLGHFDYQSHGVLDCTHLRFYTLKTGRDLLESTGLQVLSIHVTPMGLVAPGVKNSPFLQGLIHGITRAWPAVLASQFVYVAKKA